MRTNSQNLASIVGPTLIVMAVTETINFDIWSTITPPVVYLDGFILFVAGLAIIRFHNIWSGWPVFVTLTGWFVFLLGAYRMFAPRAQQAGDNMATYVFFLVMLAVGCFLTFKAFAN
jgi:hypothetical protein